MIAKYRTYIGHRAWAVSVWRSLLYEVPLTVEDWWRGVQVNFAIFGCERVGVLVRSVNARKGQANWAISATSKISRKLG